MFASNTTTTTNINDKNTGSIHLIIGCMFASKTTRLIHMAERQLYARARVLFVKPAIDTRATDIIVHSGRMTVPAVTIDDLADIKYNDYDCIAIDEGQFFADIDIYADKWANAGKVVIIAALSGNFMRKNMGDIHKLMPLCETIDKLTAVCIRCHADAHFTARLSDTEWKPSDISNIVDKQIIPSIRNASDDVGDDAGDFKLKYTTEYVDDNCSENIMKYIEDEKQARVENTKPDIDIGAQDKYCPLCRKCYNELITH